MSVAAPPSFPGHDGGPLAMVPSRVVRTWPAGHFAENLAVAEDGTVFVSLHLDNRVDRYRPNTGELDVFSRLPAPATGLAFDTAGALWVTGGEAGRSPGYVWRLSPDGTAEEWIQIPDALFLNGCAILPEQRTLLVCESLTGRILAVDQRDRVWSTWLESDRLRPENEQMPGANGIKLHRG
jgi:sugar lactone lactonase YvrE